MGERPWCEKHQRAKRDASRVWTEDEHGHGARPTRDTPPVWICDACNAERQAPPGRH